MLISQEESWRAFLQILEFIRSSAVWGVIKYLVFQLTVTHLSCMLQSEILDGSTPSSNESNESRDSHVRRHLFMVTNAIFARWMNLRQCLQYKE